MRVQKTPDSLKKPGVFHDSLKYPGACHSWLQITQSLPFEFFLHHDNFVRLHILVNSHYTVGLFATPKSVGFPLLASQLWSSG